MVNRQTNLPCTFRSLVKRRSFVSSSILSDGSAIEDQLFVTSPSVKSVSIARSMGECIRKNQPWTALRLFRNHLRTQFADEVTLALATKACSGDALRGSQIHGFAVASGLVWRTTVVNSLMSMYSKSGHFSKVLVIFETLVSPDIVSWNTVLSGFQTTDDALNFALRMSSVGVALDAFSYTTALSFCTEPENFDFARQLHCCAVKLGFDCDVFVGNALITMYSRIGLVREGRQVFDMMPRKDKVSWSAMITGYTQEVFYGMESILLFMSMIKEGIKPDNVAFTGVVAACVHEKDVQLGRQVHGLSIKTGWDDHLSVGNVLMSMYAKGGVPELSKLVFEYMKDHNVVSWTTMITIYQDDSIPIFKRMLLCGVSPNDVTLIGLYSSITNRDSEEPGRMIHGFCLKSSLLSESNVCNSLITMYSKFEKIQEARMVFEELKYKDIISWNALITGYVQNALCQEAIHTFLEAFAECKPSEYTFGSVLSAISSAEDVSLIHGQLCHSQIIKLGLFIDPVVSNALLDMYSKRGSIHDSQKVFTDISQKCQFAWTAIISAYARHGDILAVIKAFTEMEKHCVNPDSITFLSVLAACGRNGMVDAGRHFFKSMIQDYLIEPSSEHYSCMVDMLGRAGRLDEAEALLDCIPGRPGLTMLQSLLGACRIHGNASMGERIADALLELEPTDSGSYVLMSNIYAEKGHWEKVAKVRKAMRERGVRKEVGFSWLDASDVGASLSLHRFSSGDKSHAQSEDIFWMAQCLGLEMRSFKDEGRRWCNIEEWNIHSNV